MPASWAGAGAAGDAAQPPSDASRPIPTPPDLHRWWTTFNDATLTSLIDRASLANLDLRQAVIRIREARAARTITASGLWPSLDASAGFSRSRSGGGGGRTANSFRAGFDSAWELDLFGGVRRGVEAADAGVAGAVEDRRDVLVTLSAEVATTYFDLRATQEALSIAHRNLALQQQSLEITRQRQEGGYVSKLDLVSAEAQVASTTSQIPAIESSVRQSIYALGVLLGQQPASLLEELAAAAPLPPVPPEIPVGLPSDLLRRRPDIRRTEADLHAATAKIGVATADLYPHFSLSGSAGLSGPKISALGTISNGSWSFGPSASWSIFNAGRIRANIDLQEAVTDERFAAYQSTVLVALQEVENSLIAYSKEQERRAALTSAVGSNRESVDLATQLYTAGRKDFLNVLSAQQSLLNSENALVQSNQLIVTDLVALYKALGGGWDESDEHAPADPSPSGAPAPAPPGPAAPAPAAH
jgi:multidrug efflux system outer membrane protein